MTLTTLLGKNYKWWYIIKYYHVLETRYFWTNLFYFFGLSATIYINFFVWRSNNATFETIKQLLISGLFLTFTNSTIYWHIGRQIESGGLSKRLIQPNSFFLTWLMTNVGWLPSVTFYYIVAMVPLFVSVGYLPSFLSILSIIMLSIIGFLIRFCIGCGIGFSAFWSTQTYGQTVFYQSFLPLIVGALIPYSYFPEQIKNVLLYSPFAFVVHHPMQIYLGKYSQFEIFVILGVGVLWCIVMFILARIIFKLGLKRNEAVGL